MYKEKIYYDDDAKLENLNNLKVGIIGYGVQGRAQALNLRDSKINVSIREVSLKKKPDDLYAISSKGTVPVLQLSDGTIIDESLDIMLWSLVQSDEDNWMFFDKNIQLNIISINDNHFKKHLDEYKYKSKNKNIDDLFRSCGKYLDTYEKSLEKYSNILSNKISLVDVAIFPFIRQFSNVNKDIFILTYPNLKNWLDEMISLELFTLVMRKYEFWDKDSNNIERLIG